VVHTPLAAAGERDLVRGAEPDAYQLEFVLSGRCVVECRGQLERLRFGDFTIRDMSRPSALAFPTTAVTRLLRLSIPRDLAMRHFPAVTKVIGVRVPGNRGPGALLAVVLAQVAQDLELYAAVERIWISTAVLDLVGAALAAVAGEPAVADRHDDRHDDLRDDLRGDLRGDLRDDLRDDLRGDLRGDLRDDIYAFVEERLGDPDLSPAMIAKAHHISVRYLHKLFQGSGFTLGQWVRRRRLDRCRRDLGDPALADRPVAAVAARWGFSDAAHFSRSFRAAYQATPSDYRRDVCRHAA
jgi:AraC-like DNA-binding protein